MSVPLSNYGGAGTDLNKRKPVLSFADIDFESHDKKYAAATSREAIEEADKELINDLATHYADAITTGKFSITDLFQSFIGRTGIRAKVIAENTLGQIYPKFPLQVCE